MRNAFTTISRLTAGEPVKSDKRLESRRAKLDAPQIRV